MIELSYIDNSKNYFKCKIDRINKRFFECSEKSKGEYVISKWYRLFDAGKERSQDFITARYNDEEFVKCISIWFLSRYGYKLIEVNLKCQ